MGPRRGVPLALASSLVLASPVFLAAQSTSCRAGDPEVRQVSFSGNASVPARTLSEVIETRPSSTTRRLTRILGDRNCLPPGALLRDVARLMLYYRRVGYPRIAVDTLVEHHDSGSVRVRFDVRENAPIIVDAIELRGALDPKLRAELESKVKLSAGQPLDRYALDASTGAILIALRRAGYLKATARHRDTIDSTTLRAQVSLDIETGPRVRVGDVRVATRGPEDEQPALPAGKVRRLTGLKPGAVLGSQELADARRDLDAVGLFEEVSISLDTIRDPPPGDGEAVADVSVATVEGPANQVRVAAGYATLDCFRLQTRLQRSAFMRTTGQLELTANFSKIAIGDPLDFAPGMCSSSVRADPYSSQLNYYLGATYTVARAGRRAGARSVSLYSERRSEYLAFLKTTYIGGSASVGRYYGKYWSATTAYDLSYARTQAEPAVLCATFSACLEADREQFTDALPFGLLTFGATYDRTDGAMDPVRGYNVRFQFRIAPQWLGTAPRQQVFGARGGATAYRSLAPNTVFAARLMGGVVGTLPGADFIPQGERIFAGGATSVRGFRQNEVGPRVYLADSVRTIVSGPDTLLWAFPPDSAKWRAVPTGGNAGAVANLELRVRPSAFASLLQFVGFLDAGVIWVLDESDVGKTPLVVTPGVGLRASTPIGPIRLDVAYNGYAPPTGPAYRDTSVGFETAPLYCVSIGNTLPVTGVGKTDAEGKPIPPVQAEGPCPATFNPSRPRGFFDRLTLTFSIGQAF
jgi:outer membrane protein insertion porin family/translocation and assembly module TamA